MIVTSGGRDVDKDRPTHAEGAASIRPFDEAAFRLLEPLDGSPLVGDGKVNLISLDAIAARLGSRWAARSDAIYEHVERTIQRHIGEQGSAFRVSDTDYVIIQPDIGRFAAQVRCLQCMREILTFFLGQARLADLAVREVLAVAEEGLHAAQLDAAKITEHAEREAAGASPAEPVEDQWSPFIASNGRRVRVSCTLEPVLELKGYTRIGYRISRRILLVGTEEPLSAGEYSRLTRADMERIDFATLVRGMDRLRSEGDGDIPSLVLPVSYISLSSHRTRVALIDLFKKAQQLVKRGLICEVCDIDGVPQAGLLAAISFIKPYCLFVVGQVISTSDAALHNLRGCGLNGVSLEIGERGDQEAELFLWVRAVITAAKSVAKSVMIYGLPSARTAALTASLGATHASIKLSPNAE